MTRTGPGPGLDKNNIDFNNLMKPFIFTRSGRSRKSSVGSVSTNRGMNPAPRVSLPYWVKEVSRAEKYDPELELFVADDRRYNEENDPDYVLPATDDEIDTEDDGTEDEEEVSMLNNEAEKDLPEEVLEGKYK